ncbi:MAG: hypothetical protein KJ941_02920 [Bacteroidetes bacterium]|nr:hypothetical protein [Bacteroidota bacterium]
MTSLPVNKQYYFLALIVTLFFLGSCKKKLLEEMSTYPFPGLLSEWNIYSGNPTDLNPNSSFQNYELSSSLFTDYAEKQRLIFLPNDAKLRVLDDQNIEFPLNTILVKTFYYFKDKRAPSKGKQIIETRLLVKTEDSWQVATYLWNKEQTEANLISSGYTRNVSWINENGESKFTAYKIPNNSECVTCHNFDKKTIPLGLKPQNLNRTITINSQEVNQLDYFVQLNKLHPVNSENIFSLPDYSNSNLTDEVRARAYLEVNCAHCHNPNGFASHENINFLYQTSFSNMGLGPHISHVMPKLEKGIMPKLGTTMVHTEGVEIMRKYFEDAH